MTADPRAEAVRTATEALSEAGIPFLLVTFDGPHSTALEIRHAQVDLGQVQIVAAEVDGLAREVRLQRAIQQQLGPSIQLPGGLALPSFGRNGNG